MSKRLNRCIVFVWNSNCSCVFFFILFFSFDRDWKKIEAFVGSKTVIQVM